MKTVVLWLWSDRDLCCGKQGAIMQVQVSRIQTPGLHWGWRRFCCCVEGYWEEQGEDACSLQAVPK